jgi:polyphosphate kinase 2 (PPK2 family)
VLLVIQGMDTSGKGGIMRHVVGSMDPQGVETVALQGAHRRGADPALPRPDPAAPPGPGAADGAAAPARQGDVDEREHWPAHMEACDRALAATSTAHAPWTVVPADRKWYARIAVQQLLRDALERIDPTWPPADVDVDEQIGRLRATLD